MATVSIRVPDELKSRMEAHDEVNWSAVLRRHLEDELTDLDAKDVAHAVATSDRLSNAVAEDADTTLADEDVTDVIREFRDSRYGGESA
jgi:hypothetical protein